MSTVQADPGDQLDVGTVSGQATPVGDVYDPSLGRHYTFGLRAIERIDQPGRGDMAFNLFGSRLTVCSTHGGPAFVDFTNPGSEGPGPDPEDPGGPIPEATFECGRTGGDAVNIKGCVATIQFHGYQHSDYFFESYLGSVPVAIRFTKTGPNSGRLEMTTEFGKGQIKIKGNTTGHVVMSSCPD